MSSPFPVIGFFTAVLIAFTANPARGGDDPGADIPWITYEAEAMNTTGAVLGPQFTPFHIETESSGQQCVKLAAAGEYLEFTAASDANTMVVRFNLPDSEHGGGTNSALEFFVNGKSIRTLALSSHYSLVYGDYPFSNDPGKGKPRNFYDELRVKNVKVAKGDVIRLQKSVAETPACIVDLVDLEKVTPPLAEPANALSVLDFGASGNGDADDTDALVRCVAEAKKQGKICWIPAGNFKLTHDILLSSSVTIQGAGMWHTTFVGDDNLYGHADRRVRFKLSGNGIHLADFAIVGKLNYRNDDEPNDGVLGAGCSDSTVSRIWIEHTKTGAWIYNGSNLVIEGCRFRDLLADGVNLCTGTNGTIVQDCSARGTGDDCFAIWPTVSDQGYVGQIPQPGKNVIRHCTGQLPFLANGGAIYGGAGNRIEDCVFSNITAGCGVLISTTFPTSDEQRKIDNNFSGMTVISGCRLIRCGGYDHDWGWRGSFQICLDRRNISGLTIADVEIKDSFSDGLTVLARDGLKGPGTLSNARIENVRIPNFGIGASGRHGLLIDKGVAGSVTLVNSKIADVQNNSGNFAVVKE